MAKQTRNYTDLIEILEANRYSPVSKTTPRDSDAEMILQFLMLKRDANFTPEQCEIIRSINFESLRRTRAKLQSKGEYLGSPEVMRQRKIKGFEVQQTEPGDSPAALQKRIEENENVLG